MYEKPSKTQRRTIPRILHALGISLAMIGAAVSLRPADQQHAGGKSEFPHGNCRTAHSCRHGSDSGAGHRRQNRRRKETQTVTSAAAQTQAETQAETEALTDAPETQPEAEAPAHHLTAPLTEYTVLAPFSDGELVKSETTGTWQTHNGVDLACEAGSDVYAIDIGTVSSVCNDALWGYTVTINHDNGVTSRYCGLDGSLEVREAMPSRADRSWEQREIPPILRARRIPICIWRSAGAENISTPWHICNSQTKTGTALELYQFSVFILSDARHLNFPADTSRSGSHKGTFLRPWASVSKH